VLEWCDAVFEFAAKPSRFRFNAVDLGLAISEAPFNAAEATTHFGAERISFNLQQDEFPRLRGGVRVLAIRRDLDGNDVGCFSEMLKFTASYM